MALDGLVIHSIVDELHKKLLGGKIDKVYQPENDEVVLHIRNNKENFKLFMGSIEETKNWVYRISSKWFYNWKTKISRIWRFC